jgi:hypothetical protein
MKEGERKVRKHSISKRRTRRKLHLPVDSHDQKVVAVKLTANFVGDAEVLLGLLKQVEAEEAIAAVSTDGA